MKGKRGKRRRRGNELNGKGEAGWALNGGSVGSSIAASRKFPTLSFLIFLFILLLLFLIYLGRGKSVILAEKHCYLGGLLANFLLLFPKGVFIVKVICLFCVIVRVRLSVTHPALKEGGFLVGSDEHVALLDWFLLR